MRDIASIYKVL